MDIVLTLNVDQVNTILRCLGKHPFEEAASIVNTIQQQGREQVAAQQEVAKEEASETESQEAE